MLAKGKRILECPVCGNDNEEQLLVVEGGDSQFYCENCGTEFIDLSNG